MKLSELGPCDSCGGPVGVVFEVVTVRKAMVKAKAVRQAQGGVLAHGMPLQISEAMGIVRDSERAVVVAGEGDDGGEFGDLATELHLCQDCTVRPIVLAALVERRGAAESQT